MAGFEVVVRPVIFPDIRPRAKPSLPPQDDPEKGLAVIQGNPAQAIGLSESWNINSSHTKPVETERRVDQARVYQMNDAGAVNKDNFIDIEVANKITMEEPTPDGESVKKEHFYKKLSDADKNVEVRRRNVVKKATDQ